MKMECTLCGEKLEKDKDWNARKKAHNEKHTREGWNNIIGTPKWVTVWD